MTRAARLRRQNRRQRRAIVRRGRDRVVGRRPSGAGARLGSLPKVRGGGGARDDAWQPRWVAAPHRTQSASLPPPFVAARTPSATRLSGHLEGSPRPAPVGRAGRRGPRAPREAAARPYCPGGSGKSCSKPLAGLGPFYGSFGRSNLPKIYPVFTQN